MILNLTQFLIEKTEYTPNVTIQKFAELYDSFFS